MLRRWERVAVVLQRHALGDHLPAPAVLHRLECARRRPRRSMAAAGHLLARPGGAADRALQRVRARSAGAVTPRPAGRQHRAVRRAGRPGGVVRRLGSSGTGRLLGGLALLLADVVGSGADASTGGPIDVMDVWRRHRIGSQCDPELLICVVSGLAAALHRLARRPVDPLLPHRSRWARRCRSRWRRSCAGTPPRCRSRTSPSATKDQRQARVRQDLRHVGQELDPC